MSPSIIAGAGIATVILHFLMRVLNSGQMAMLLARFGIPAIPSKAIPWISISIGLGAGIADALVQGMGWRAALESVFAGLFAGTGAVAIHETAGQVGKPADPPAP